MARRVLVIHEAGEPRYLAWAGRIAELLEGNRNPVVVGHSFGASVLLKYLCEAARRPPISGVFLVATPFWGAEFPEFALPSDFGFRLRDLAPLFLTTAATTPRYRSSSSSNIAEHYPKRPSGSWMAGDTNSITPSSPSWLPISEASNLRSTAPCAQSPCFLSRSTGSCSTAAPGAEDYGSITRTSRPTSGWKVLPSGRRCLACTDSLTWDASRARGVSSHHSRPGAPAPRSCRGVGCVRESFLDLADIRALAGQRPVYQIPGPIGPAPGMPAWGELPFEVGLEMVLEALVSWL